jgi:hypothetical protein
MTHEWSAAQELVYGDLNGNLVFITKERADYLAAIHRSLWSSSTWGEVHERMPTAAYEELLEISGATELPGFEEYYENERRSRPGLTRDEARAEYLALSADERRPEPGDPFQAGDIGAICDGDWPGWTEQEMLAWVPKAIQEQYGQRSFSFVSGDCLMFRLEDEDRLVAAFVAHGYACVRDDALVRRASGYGT